MSEYVEISQEITDDPDVMLFYTNLLLAEEVEAYDSVEAMLEGSSVAQALGVIAGIQSAILEIDTVTIQRESFTDWYAISADVSAVLRDFFL